MVFAFFDRVKETATTTGAGDFTLAGAASGFRTFASVFATNDTTYYVIDGGAEWEVGLGTYSAANTLTRTTVLASSNAGAAVNFSAGTKNVFVDVPAAALPKFVKTLYKSNVKTTHTGDTNETTLFDYTLPANTLGANDDLEITTVWSRPGSETSTTTNRIRFSTISGTTYQSSSMSVTNLSLQMLTTIRANNATNAQKGFNASGQVYGVSTAALFTSAVDTTAATHIVGTCSPATAGDHMSIESVTIKQVRP